MNRSGCANRAAQQGLGRRAFVGALAGAGLAGGAAWYGLQHSGPSSNAKARVAIVGGGAAGLSVSARLRRALPNAEITLIEPSRQHFYQPGFTLVAAGVFAPSSVVRPEADLLPAGVRWLEDRVIAAEPESNRLLTAAHGPLSYDFLVLAPGLQMNFDAIQGISRERLGEANIHCIYDYASAQRCWAAIQQLAQSGGRAVFTDTWTKLKCGGAPKKINLIAEDYCRLHNARQKTSFQYFSALDHLFDVPVFNQRLLAIYQQRNIPIAWKHRLQSVDPATKTATFLVPDSGQTVNVPFDLLHFVPPMSAPDFVKSSALARDPKTGKSEDWAPTDKFTLVHKGFPNILAVGDVAALPTSKTGAAIRSQAPVAATNLVDLIDGRAPSAHYNGYTACPVVTEYGKVLLAEFGYDKKPTPSLPFLDPAVEHAAGWHLKVHALKPLYFEGMLRGRA